MSAVARRLSAWRGEKIGDAFCSHVLVQTILCICVLSNPFRLPRVLCTHIYTYMLRFPCVNIYTLYNRDWRGDLLHSRGGLLLSLRENTSR